jgi:type I restriction enzyme S subunit
VNSRSFKTTGIDWMPRLPATWECKRLKRVVELVTDKATANDASRYVGLENVESGTGRLLAGNGEQESSGTRFRCGDVLFGKLRPYLTKALAPDFDGRCTSEMLVLRPKRIGRRFLHHYCLSHAFVQLVDSSTFGAKMPRADWEFIGGMAVPLPPEEEADAIAVFLDRETARLDRLVVQKEKLLALLEEKRASLITHAVTRSLNPHAPTKPSGIPWIGDMPAHWEVKPLKSGFWFEKGPNAQLLTASYIADHAGEYPVYSGQTEQDGIMGRIDSYVYDTGPVIFTTTVGARVMTARVVEGKYSLSQNCLIMRPRSTDVCAPYFNHQLVDLFRYERGSIPSHMQPSLRMSDLSQYKVAFPPAGEQRAIAASLDAFSETVAALTAKLVLAIALLRERRTALISAAVTGQIDVRKPAAV